MWRAASHSVTQTQKLGRALAKHLRPGDILGFTGNLGAGKTTFIQGIAEGLGLPNTLRATSPTFTLVNEYPTIPRLFHYDFYRLNQADELWETGYDDATRSEGIIVAEWFDRVAEAAEEAHLLIHIEGQGRDRTFTLEPHGDSWEHRFDSLASFKRVNP